LILFYYSGHGCLTPSLVAHNNMKNTFSILIALLCFGCAYTYLKPNRNVLEKFDALNKINTSRSKLIDSLKLTSDTNSKYQSVLKKLRETEGINEITGIPNKTEPLATVAEVALLATHQPPNFGSWLFIRTNFKISNLCFYGMPIFTGNYHNYNKFLKSIGTRKHDIFIKITEVNLFHQLFYPSLYHVETVNTKYIVIVDFLDNYACGENRTKYRLFIDSRLNVTAFNVLYDFHSDCFISKQTDSLNSN
jgi:hypothetical protein